MIHYVCRLAPFIGLVVRFVNCSPVRPGNAQILDIRFIRVVNDEIDLCPDMTYENSVPAGREMLTGETT